MDLNNIKIGVIDYLATGEGRTIFIYCNLRNKKPSHVEMWDFYAQGLEEITAAELIANETSTANIVNSFAPFLKNVFEQGSFGNIDFYQRFHINYS